MARQASFASALRAALRAAPIQPADKAAVRLAHRYAEELDGDDGDLLKLGPQLLAVLTALGLTPAGRALVLGKGVHGADAPATPLDELRRRRDQRARGDGPETVDAPAP